MPLMLQYRDIIFHDTIMRRLIHSYIAVLIITVFGALATLFIVHVGTATQFAHYDESVDPLSTLER
jgi:hypothetical protein